MDHDVYIYTFDYAYKSILILRLIMSQKSFHHSCYMNVTYRCTLPFPLTGAVQALL